MADQRIQYTERLVGNNHPTYDDTLNRLCMVEHNSDGTHKNLVDAGTFGSLTTTLAAVTTDYTVIVTDTQNLTGPVTIAHNVIIMPTGIINIISGEITFSGTVIKGNYSGFSGAGTYTIPSGGVGSNQNFVCKGVTASSVINESEGTDIVSATTTDIGVATGNYVKVTGTTTITGFGTVQAGARRIVEFSDSLILTHNGTSLILPNAANITTVSGDVLTFVSLGSGNWKCIQAPNYFYRSTEKIIKGTINNSGGIIDGSGFTVTSFTAGQCTIAFTSEFSTSPVVVASSLNNTVACVIASRTVSGAVVNILGGVNGAFSFIAIG